MVVVVVVVVVAFVVDGLVLLLVVVVIGNSVGLRGASGDSSIWLLSTWLWSEISFELSGS